jgi:type VII secretion-associated protein (TIGR03931 family)
VMPHRAVIETGPGAIRRLCCDPYDLSVADAEMATAALDAVDDAVALVADCPVFVDSLWRAVLQSLAGGSHDSLVVVHPSWWSTSRVKVIATAAASLADDVVTRPRSWLLAQAPSVLPPRKVVVEIADRFVVITGAVVVAERRDGEPDRVAETVTRAVAEMTAGTAVAVLIDAPITIAGAAALGTMIAGHLRATDLTVVEFDDAELCGLAATAFSADEEPAASQAEPVAGLRIRRRTKAFILLAGAVVVLAAGVLGVGIVRRNSVPANDGIPTTFLVEGRIAVTVPAQWSTRRVVSGPGSARIQVTSPTDPEIALHITQSPVPDKTLSGTAEVLRRAIDAEPSGVFVDFNPSGRSADRPAVTYREMRAGHHIRWTVLLDGTVRISIGCQSRPAGEAAVRDVCELAVRSARALR